jgi:hypothetical protein
MKIDSSMPMVNHSGMMPCVKLSGSRKFSTMVRLMA